MWRGHHALKIANQPLLSRNNPTASRRYFAVSRPRISLTVTGRFKRDVLEHQNEMAPLDPTRVRARRPLKRALLQPLVVEREAAAIPDEQLDVRLPAVQKDKHIARGRVAPKVFADQPREQIGRASCRERGGEEVQEG